MTTPISDAAPSPLITVRRLAALLGSDDPPVVCDVRWSLASGGDENAYAAGHIPGAVFVHMEHDLSGAPGSEGRHPLPDVATFVAAMQRAGISEQSRVVVYDEGPALSAARAWWLLRYVGHAETYVLDGGLAAWTAEGLPTSTDVPKVEPGDLVAGASLAATVDVDDVLTAAEVGTLLDARDLERYLGVVEPVDTVAGHIPGAVSASTKANLGPDGRFLSPEVLQDRFEAVGVTADQPVTVYCGSGITAAHEILALQVAGFPAALYPGSWSHWIVDPRRPIATGAPA